MELDDRARVIFIGRFSGADTGAALTYIYTFSVRPLFKALRMYCVCVCMYMCAYMRVCVPILALSLSGRFDLVMLDEKRMVYINKRAIFSPLRLPHFYEITTDKTGEEFFFI